MASVPHQERGRRGESTIPSFLFSFVRELLYVNTHVFASGLAFVIGQDKHGGGAWCMCVPYLQREIERTRTLLS